ncbi:unnamed protein product [Musa textilis]
MQAKALKNVLRSREWRSLSLPIASALFHSSPVSLAKRSSNLGREDERRHEEPSKNYIRYSVHQKRADARGALKNILFNETHSKQYFQDEDITWRADRKSSRNFKVEDSSYESDKHQRPKYTGKAKHQRTSNHQKGKCGRIQCRKNGQSFDDEDDDYGHPNTKFSASFGGQRCFTWSFNSQDRLHFENFTNGFEWRDHSQQAKARTRVWSESDIEEEDESSDIGLQSHRFALGLPMMGPLKLNDVKCAFRSSALKWHPDKHEGTSQAVAEEKFKLCVEAYKTLCKSLKSS